MEGCGIDLRLGCCLSVMPTLPAASIDLVLADLPYGSTACRWDQIIPFEPLWACYRRLLKPRGAVVLTASQPFTSMLVMSNREWFRYSQVWEKNKPTNIFQAKVRPLSVHEDILTFTPEPVSNRLKNTTFHPQGVIASGTIYRQNPRENVISSYRRSHVSEYRYQGTNYPRSVIRFPGESGLHPTQKPVPLMEYLIRTYTDEGDTVLDNVFGSGTTLVAAVKTGRRAIGIEKDPAYFAIAERRIAAETEKFTLFGAGRA